MSTQRRVTAFHLGQVFALGPREITKDEVIAFAREFDPQPFHLDEAAARASILGGLAASGWHTTSLLLRMIRDALPGDAAAVIAIDDVKWLKPVLVGEVLAGTCVIKSVDAGAGTFTLAAFLENTGAIRKIDLTVTFAS